MDPTQAMIKTVKLSHLKGKFVSAVMSYMLLFLDVKLYKIQDEYVFVYWYQNTMVAISVKIVDPYDFNGLKKQVNMLYSGYSTL